MDDVTALAVTCPGCGVALAQFHVAHFEAGRRSTTIELLCPTHGCEHHGRPDGHVGTAQRRDGATDPALPTQRLDEPV
ncbi:hypothetical protein [Nocardioides marmoraquaticus]